MCREVTFSYCPAAGFQVKANQRLAEGPQKKLDSHVETIEKIRKLVNLTGEAIVLSLVSDDKLWQEKALLLA